MVVAESAGVKIGSSTRNVDSTAISFDSRKPDNVDKSKPPSDFSVNSTESDYQLIGANEVAHLPRFPVKDGDGDGDVSVVLSNGESQVRRNGMDRGVENQQMMLKYGGDSNETNSGSSGADSDIEELVEILSKLNPMAEEFVPPSLAHYHEGSVGHGRFDFPIGLMVGDHTTDAVKYPSKRKSNNHNQGRRRMNNRTNRAQSKEVIRRTVYVSDIDHQVTEEQLAAVFNSCGQVVDCRVCGDPNSCLRFAFIEFTDEEGATAALNLAGMMLGFYPVRVMPSKTAIAPVNPTLLPKSEDEREMCSRTVYCTNIDKKVLQEEVKLFFEFLCGKVRRLRLLGANRHPTRIAFVEFMMAESAIAALSCSGAVLGSLRIRVSPSKTPVRPRLPRSPMH